MAQGDYFKVSRKVFDHWLVEEDRPLTKFEAWLKLISLARFKPSRRQKIMNGFFVSWNRGQLVGSLRFLKQAFNWGSDTKVRSFLSLLEKDNMITQDKTQGISVITICKYDTYNPLKDTDNAEENAGATQGKRRVNAGATQNSKNGNKGKKGNKEETELSEKPKFSHIKILFEEFRKEYPGKKRGLETELSDFKKKHSDWKKIIPELKTALDSQKKHRAKLSDDPNNFIAPWKMLKTWLFQRCWEEETGTSQNGQAVTDSDIPESYKILDPQGQVMEVTRKADAMKVGGIWRALVFKLELSRRSYFENKRKQAHDFGHVYTELYEEVYSLRPQNNEKTKTA